MIIRALLLCASLVVSLEAGATPLNPNLCVGSGGSANYAPLGLPAWQPGDPGRPMLRRTLTGVNSRCNDGSPAVMYLRPAPVGGQSDKWVIQFEGGGGCRGEQSCFERWCGLTGQIFDRAGKMSSLGAAGAITEQGGLTTERQGDFADYNHVVVHYCSSDNWIGSAPVGTPLDPASGLPLTYDIEFQGEHIVADVIDTLRAGLTFADPEPAEAHYNIPMPDLDTARRVILSGDSAGGGGLRHHLDRIAEELLLNSVNPAGVQVVGVVDAGFAPSMYAPAIVWAPANPLVPYTSYVDMLTHEHQPVTRGLWGVDDSALDQSCLVLAPTPSLYCLDTNWTLKHHITTPFFLHQDLADPVAADRYIQWGIFASSEDYAQATANQLWNLLNPGLEARTVSPGVLGLHCRNHIASRESRKFFSWSTTTGAAQPFHDLLSSWINGAAAVNIQPDAPPAGYSLSFCP